LDTNGGSLAALANGAVVPPCANGGTLVTGVAAVADARSGDGLAALSTGFAITLGAPGAAGFTAMGTTLRTVGWERSAGVSCLPAREGGSTTHENGISGTVGRFSSGTKGIAVADETRRLISGGGIGGQLPPGAGDASAEDDCASRCGGV
jgi:hypothetical protein